MNTYKVCFMEKKNLDTTLLGLKLCTRTFKMANIRRNIFSISQLLVDDQSVFKTDDRL